MKKIVCLDCGSEDLVEYREKLITEYRKINNDNSVSKRKTESLPDYNNPTGIMCRNCKSCFDYKTNDNGKIIAIAYKED